MRKDKQLRGLLELCENLQSRTHSGDVTTDLKSLQFSCDLLLKNMIMILEKEKNGENITSELSFLTNNLLGANAHLTGKRAEKTVAEYNIF